ncbi:DUF4399 domain-containing protein [Minwuia thermotolerans]|uniref:Rod shape-determining protein RodA n=1 Tax=Minwuia thermotolerans TaxID=2056226 RepID=A0A2M9G4X8_9PROT|nr:DUF4399 domain-containing protein [Minwuia thermotolerans]PJK30779.1 rod shape-determining protein RodA [Minwuia thermotolerans]
MKSLIAALAILAAPALALAESSPWPADAELYIVSPKDGDTVSSPFRVVFGVKGVAVRPAGDETPGSGHHHLLIDRIVPAGEDLQYSLPAEDSLVHFGKGQTAVELRLPSGPHTLQLIMGDANHIPHDPPLVSEPIRVIVRNQ